MDTDFCSLQVGDKVMVECNSGMASGGESTVTKLSEEYISEDVDGYIVHKAEKRSVIWFGGHAFDAVAGHALNKPTEYYMAYVISEGPHPVQFSRKQVKFIQHMMNEVAFEYFEDDCADLVSTIDKAEEGE